MENGKDEDWDTVVRFLAGECTPGDARAVAERAGRDPEFRRMLDEATRLWGLSDEAQTEPKWPEAWASLDQRIRAEARTPQGHVTPLATRTRYPATRPPHRASRPRWAAAGGGAAVLLLVVWAIVLSTGRPSAETVPEAAVKTFATVNGQRATVRLADGSTVRLNAGSRLSVASDFGHDGRTVELEGEAHFDVQHLEGVPFTVRVAEAEIAVLGTEFNVQAYPEQTAMSVAVVDGVVALRRVDTPGLDGIRLERNDVGVVERRSGQTQFYRDVALDTYLAWTQDRLHFENTPLVEVARTIERWFDRPLFVEDAALGDRLLTAEFADESFEQVIRAISLALRFDYDVRGDTVRIRLPQ